MSVSLSEVKRAARAHRAPLAGESAGYLVLALADQVLSAPRLIEPGDIQLTEDGGLRLLRGQASSESDAELSLRRALDALLLVASSGSAALMRAGRRTSATGLPALVRELEAALIPVNRAAARRALARLHRETVRAVAGGLLPDEQPDAPARVESTSATPSTVRSEPVGAFATVEEHLENAPIDLPAALSSLDGVVSAISEDDAPLAESPYSDALTVALDVRGGSAEDDVIELDEDVEFIDEEPSDALTVARNVEVAPISMALVPEEARVELPEEACTRPEPVILRQAQRPLGRVALPPPVVEALPRTPTLGSLAAELPVLAPQQIAELSAAQAEVVCSAPLEECTERMPEVESLLPGVAIVTSRKSDVSELLEKFQVGEDDTRQGLCRAIKEMAGLDMTPAPFAALIR
jgi:hypothetical protein